VSAELLDKDDQLVLYQLVNKFIQHSKNHLDSPSSRCNRKGRCIYSFPHLVRERTTVDEYGRVLYRRRTKESAWITPYIPALLLLLRCHVYIDICFIANVVLYLYKYLFKGQDTTRFDIAIEVEPCREIDDFQIGRYLSSNEAA
jgi:hypothetical protein